MDTKELEKIVKFCRKNGITRLKNAEIEIELSPIALFPESAYKKAKLAGGPAEPEVENAFSEEDILNWSSGGIPEERAS